MYILRFIVGTSCLSLTIKVWRCRTFISICEFAGIGALLKRWRPQLKNHLSSSGRKMVPFSFLICSMACFVGQVPILPYYSLVLFYITPVSITQMWI